MGDVGVSTPLLTVDERTMYTFDDIIRQRAIDEDQSPLIAYPKTKLGVTDYELFTGVHLNRLVDGAAKALIKAGIPPVYEDTVAGIYGLSELDYIITIFGLGRLGYTIFILSPRLPVNACVNLLSSTKAPILFYAPQFLNLATRTSQELPLKLLPILTRPEYDIPDDASPPFERTGIDGEKETLKNLIMMHSSGSTGLPRPIFYTHKRLLATLLTAQNLIAFQSVPLFHAHGFISFIQAIFKRKTIYLFNGNVPQTHDTVTAAIKAAKPEIVWTVPYVLKLLAEKRDGIDALKECKVVSSSGSRCPDELGDLITREGIHFGTAFGATEVALILTSLNRPREDKAWNYLRPPPHVAPFIYMKPIDGKICECVVLDGHKGKMMSNSNDPPNSFHTKDLFIGHPTVPNAWKFVGRLDDRVTLTNGEKVLPLPIEGRIQQDPLVKEAVVFGIDRSVPGLLLFKATAAAGLSNEEFLDRMWPAIEDANRNAEGFSQISRDMVAIIPENIDCPTTDKSSIKRAQVYRDFAEVIDGVYTRSENSKEGALVLGIPELQDWILKSFQEMGIPLDGISTDFFSAGVDSLKAIQMRALIIKSLNLGGNVSRCGSMIVYDTGNTAKLAKALFDIRTNAGVENRSVNELEEMRQLIGEYSKFERRAAWNNVPVNEGERQLYEKYPRLGRRAAWKGPENNVVLLTGATGSLGSHILSQLVATPSVSRIYCLVRTASSTQTVYERVKKALQERGFPDQFSSGKVYVIESDLTRSDFAISAPVVKQILGQITHIIHCAWEVNFTLPVSSFVPQLRGLQNLINCSLTSPFSNPPHLLFCSSVGTAMATPEPSSSNEIIIPEAPINELSDTSPTGYARSKLIAERMLENAVSQFGARATILRIGQIIPARETGSQLWNESEMIPLMIRSALTTGTLPVTPGGGDQCSWIDLGTLSKAIVEIAEVGWTNLQRGPSKDLEQQLVYNLVHPRPFSWKSHFLPALADAGLEFKIVFLGDWLDRLRNSDRDPAKNPSRKLLGFWEGQSQSRKVYEIKFETKLAEARIPAMRTTENVVDGDYVRSLLKAWRDVW